MISFFRKIRKSLLAQSKLTQYIVYALGEILLVMVGILLALQVNDWRDQLLTKKEEINTLQLIITDLETDSSDLENFSFKLQQFTNSAVKFIYSIESSAPLDSVAIYARRATFNYNYRPRDLTFQGLKQSGRLDLISDLTVRNRLIGYFDEIISYLDDLRQNQKELNEDVQKALLPYFGFYPTSDSTSIYRSNADISQLNNNVELTNTMGAMIESRQHINNRIKEFFLPENILITELLKDYLASISAE